MHMLCQFSALVTDEVSEWCAFVSFVCTCCIIKLCTVQDAAGFSTHVECWHVAVSWHCPWPAGPCTHKPLFVQDERCFWEASVFCLHHCCCVRSQLTVRFPHRILIPHPWSVHTVSRVLNNLGLLPQSLCIFIPSLSARFYTGIIFCAYLYYYYYPQITIKWTKLFGVDKITYSLREVCQEIQHTWWSFHHIVDYFSKSVQHAVFVHLFQILVIVILLRNEWLNVCQIYIKLS